MKTILFIILINFQLFVNCETQLDNEQYDLEYTLNDSERYDKLTTLNLKTLKQNQNQYLQNQLPVVQSSLNAPLNTNSQYYFTQVYSESLNDKLRNQLVSAYNDDDTASIIKFRLCGKSGCVVATYLYLHTLLSSNNLQLNLTLHLNQNLNLVNSLIIKLASNPSDFDASKPVYLTVNANVLNIRQAQQPDTHTYVEKVKKEIETKKDQAQEGQKSFFQKYWFYIVPFVVIMFISSFAAPEAGAA